MYSIEDLVGKNAFEILGYVQKALETEGKTQKEKEKYIAEATSGDYKHLISVSRRMCNKLNK